MHTIFAVSMMLSLIDSGAVLDKAAEQGFYYRNVTISAVEKCDSSEICVDLDKMKYSIRKKDSVKVKSSTEKGKITINITPEETFISYFLYVEYKTEVRRIQMKVRNIVIDHGVADIYRIQLVGTAPEGPVIIWGKTFKEAPVHQFSESFEASVGKLRQIYSLKPLQTDETLRHAAEISLSRITNEGLVHYSAKTGSVRHSGVRKQLLGENLYTAQSEEKAWSMLVKSPSHLYNLINPQFKKFYHLQKKENGIINGVMIFSE